MTASPTPWRGLLALFLVSAAVVGFETALTRYFAVAEWSEYGYWVISIVMVGFAFSGVALALVRDRALHHAAALHAILPPLMILAAAAGYHFTTTNGFNPLQLQNPATLWPQLGHIGLYYVALLPFFFLAGLFVSLSFVREERAIGRVYAFDLVGAGAGAALVLGLLRVLGPFQLVPALLPLLALAGVLTIRSRTGSAKTGRSTSWRPLLLTLLLLLGTEAWLLGDDRAGFNEFKAIYAPLHVPGAKIVAQRRSPRGLYLLLDDFTERLDTDISNDAAMLGLGGPPRSLGLYRDGNRIAALPEAPDHAARYAAAELDALPYLLRPGATALLVGASGGFRIAAALALGASRVMALEPDPVLYAALRHGLGPAPALPSDPRVTVSANGPLAAIGGVARFGLIDISADFRDADEANATAFTAEALAADLAALAPDGVLSVPVSIREFPAYALRMLATLRRALQLAGMAEPGAHVVVYRSAWNLRILVSRTAWNAADIAAIRRFCDQRSFDVSYYPGIDVAAARAGIYNDLPQIRFEDGAIPAASGPQDAIADEAGAALDGLPSLSQRAFNLAPITLDRPFFTHVLRLDRLGLVLRRLEILPQAEIGQLVNLAVLVQAVVIALLVLAVPLLGGRGPGQAARPALYFAALGLGFLFIEIYLIEKASLYLNDRTSAFALVLSFMLVFSGLGSLASSRIAQSGLGRFGMMVPALLVVLWCLVLLGWLQPVLLATLGWPWLLRAALLVAVLAPAAFLLGVPFPLGLARLGAQGSSFLPWAWAVNGAFSVLATPLANLLATEAGYSRLLLAAAGLYMVSALAFPMQRKSLSWLDIPQT